MAWKLLGKTNIANIVKYVHALLCLSKNISSLMKIYCMKKYYEQHGVHDCFGLFDIGFVCTSFVTKNMDQKIISFNHVGYVLSLFVCFVWLQIMYL